MLAAQHGHGEVAEVLLGNGADTLVENEVSGKSCGADVCDWSQER